ncbi:MAG: T9SS C-terminal target domain-containing protein [Bacteroidetes bacterium]|nr:T9SS C-terminal target domain-containing protein [Bacteroidota bacterium]
MRKEQLLKNALVLALAISAVAGCKKDDTEDPPVVIPGSKVVTLKDSIMGNRILSADSSYLLKGFVYVINGSTLTIPAGTVIKGDKDTKGTLIVERGGKLQATGTADKPVVFTSNQAVGSRSYGDWGGIIICGRAPVNQPAGEIQIEGGPRSFFGGADPADNSGTLKYVRIEFCGIALEPNKEINGLTLGGVGNGTTIDHVQISYSGDDAFEFFGGTVNAKHLISHRALDDDFDTDFGYSGKIQFAVALRDPNNADVSGSNGFESDNDANGNSYSPYTSPIFSNVSVFGPKANSGTVINTNFKRAVHLRRNTKLSCFNSVFAGYPYGLLLDGSAVEANVIANDISFKHNVIAGCDTAYKQSGGTGALDIGVWFSNNINQQLPATSDLAINDAFNLTNPNFLPMQNSVLLGNANFSDIKLQDSFFESVNYQGAFGATNWTDKWGNFNPQQTTYN